MTLEDATPVLPAGDARVFRNVAGGIVPVDWVRLDCAEVAPGWMDAGRRGEILGPAVVVGGQAWVPLLWDDEEDPSWHKEAGLRWVHGPRDLVLGEKRDRAETARTSPPPGERSRGASRTR